MKSKNVKNSYSALRWMQYIFFSGAILFYGRTVFVPLAFSVLTAFVLYPLCHWMESRRLPRVLSIFVSLSVLVTLSCGIFYILARQIQTFFNDWPVLHQKINGLVASAQHYLTYQLNMPEEKQDAWLETLTSTVLVRGADLAEVLLYNSALGIGFLILVPFFTALLLFHRERFASAMIAVFPLSNRNDVFNILQQTVTTFYNFVTGMALVYLIVAILNMIALTLLGIPHAVLFGIIVSLLTCIPYVGITIGSLLPITMALLSHDSLWYPAGVIMAFVFIQYLEANIIFPIVVGHKLGLNTFFVVLATLCGGILWGAAGMVLFVPFLGILKLVADKVESWHSIANLIGTGDPLSIKKSPDQELISPLHNP